VNQRRFEAVFVFGRVLQGFWFRAMVPKPEWQRVIGRRAKNN
jgi:hypothetical protein